MVSTAERPKVANGNRPTGGRAAIYLRVSSHKQEDGASLDVQLESCRRYCEKTGLAIVAEFKDVESGLHVDRPQYQQALSMARSKGFDQLVVFRYDRTGRDDAEYAGMLKDFAKQSIQLVSASGESPDPLYQKLAGVLAWDESRRLSIRVTGSKMKRHADGKWNGKALLGYSIQRHPEGGCYLEPNEHAPLVAEMFTRYAGGQCSLMDLRGYLSQAGVKRSRYAIWYTLTNRVYIGEVPHGKSSTSPFMPKAPLEWTAGKHTPLVTREEFEQVQVRLSENKHRQRGGPAAKYLFSGLVVCGLCGSKFQARTFKRRGAKEYIDYRCNRKHGFGDCQAPSVLESRIREKVMPSIEKVLAALEQQDMRTALTEERARRRENADATGQVQKLTLAHELEILERRLSRWEDSLADADGTMTKERFIQRRDEVMPRIAELKAQLAAQPQRAMPGVEAVMSLYDKFSRGSMDAEAWRQWVEVMVDQVVVSSHQQDKGGHCRAHGAKFRHHSKDSTAWYSHAVVDVKWTETGAYLVEELT